MSTDWTPEELASLPQTTTVFDRPSMIFNHHEWRQEGYFVMDACSPPSAACHHVGIPIPSGSLLIKEEKGYRLVDEVTRK